MPSRILYGVVVSDKNDKTVLVEVEDRVLHPIYKKYVRRHRKYAVHDENNTCKVGDLVKILESRPFSKTKRWIIDCRV